jgi:hypothetical protein
MRYPDGPYALMVREGVPCLRRRVEGTLGCLRATTRRFLRGPSLIAPLSASGGATIRVAVRLPGRAPAAPAGPVVLRPDGASPGASPGPLVRSGGSVVLPDAEPGEYRLVALVATAGGGRPRGLGARITIREPTPVPAHGAGYAMASRFDPDGAVPRAPAVAPLAGRSWAVEGATREAATGSATPRQAAVRRGAMLGLKRKTFSGS